MMAGIGAGFGAFADGMSSGYMMGSQFKKGMEENQSNGQDENVGTGVQQYAATHDVLGLPDLMQGSGQQDPMMQGAAKAIEAVATGGKDGKSAAPWAALTAIISNSKI